MSIRQVVLDTETTGLSPKEGHRIIEIGCVELIDRQLTGNTYHQYINPERKIDKGAIAVHGITNDFLQDKPGFADVADTFHRFIEGAELIIHNAPFDVSFIDHEFRKVKKSPFTLKKSCDILDTLVMARKKHPGQRNSLDALCKRYYIDNSDRSLHGALLDAQLLAKVYLLMTGGQTSLFEEDANNDVSEARNIELKKLEKQYKIPIIFPQQDELVQHKAQLEKIGQESGGNCIWLKTTEAEDG